MIWIGAALTAGVSYFSLFAIRPVLMRLGVVDVPNGRSSHTTTTVRGAGIGPLIGILVGIAFALTVGVLEGGAVITLIVLVMAPACATLGLVEDAIGIPVPIRAALQLLIGVAASAAILIFTGVMVWWVILGAIIVAGYINVVNFMDGINGISGMHAIVVGVTYSALGGLFDQSWMVWVGIVLAAAFAGFLPWNAVRGRVFLGDSGSYLLGGTIAVVAIGAVAVGVPALALVGPVAIYLADAGYTLARRVTRGERWYQAHHSHVYQRLTANGRGHISVTLLVTTFTLLTSAIGLLSLLSGSLWTAASAGGIIVFAAIYLWLPKLLNEPQLKTSISTNSQKPVALDASMVDKVAAHSWAVIGGSGFVGTNIVALLRAAGADVIALKAPRLSLAYPSTVSQILAADVVGAEELIYRDLCGKDVVINAAGLASPDSNEMRALLGANALLPVVVARAADRASAQRFVHISSAAVQGARPVLDESTDVAPFSPYSQSKALGEQALAEWKRSSAPTVSVVAVRATSVQGAGRKTTERLRQFAKLPIASVAAPGTQHSPVSSVIGLVNFVAQVGVHVGAVPSIVLQPWEGMSTQSVLLAASGRMPLVLPAAVCRIALGIGHLAERVTGGRIAGPMRRLELMWFGQQQEAVWARSVGLEGRSFVSEVLATGRRTEQ